MDRSRANTWTSDALQRGDIGAIQERFAADPGYAEARDFVGDTPLLTAVSFDHLPLVAWLLDRGADPNAPVDDGYTCLLTAVESDSADSVSLVDTLLRAGADVNAAGTNGWTPLHMAAAHGHVQKARLLIGAGADVNRRKDIDGEETPLMEAAHAGRAGAVSLLLASGADASLRDTVHGRTPLDTAKSAACGLDPGVLKLIESEFPPGNAAALLSEAGVPADGLGEIAEAVGALDFRQMYRDATRKRLEEGDFAAVIRILEAHAGSLDGGERKGEDASGCSS
ncbi:ankyrin repeat domain-containing protein [Phycisphaera mikurensis]|nr:ankyrin repeat domain-containing protein [Phycisphaera mikurensis]MBB6443347.1 hypothetical protein [Phycisphaera mikurensis]